MSVVELDDFQNTVAGLAAKRLLDQSVIPAEERNDALILAEAAMLGCQVLISSDAHLRDANPMRVAQALREKGVPMVIIRKPTDIVREFAGR